MAKSYASCKRYRNIKPDKEKSENVGNFYVQRPRVGRSEDEMYRNGHNDFGNKASGDNGPLPMRFSGMIAF
jgi:hypothetical protein